MTRIPIFLFAVLAAVVLGAGSQPMSAQSGDGAILMPEMRIFTIGPADVIPDAGAPGMFQGIVGSGANPPAPGDWPCYGGGSGCPNAVPGSLVVAQPQAVVSYTCNGCAEVYYTFQTTTLSGTADISITVVQGKNTIFSNSYSFPGIPAQSNQIITTGLIFASNAKKGPAKIKVSTTIGATTILGSAAIYLK